MSRPRSLTLGGVLFALAGISATSFHARTTPSATTRQIIAVYLGTEGTDAGMVTIVRDMKAALSHQTAATNREFIARGVSLDPSVDGGIRHLALLGPFDEIAVGGNWTNSAVIRYLGGDIGATRSTAIPQLVLLERDVNQAGERLQVSPEREIARFVGTKEIGDWVHRGAPLP
jgi:hypothetical protein